METLAPQHEVLCPAAQSAAARGAELSVAVIIPVKGDNEKLKLCLERCLALDYAAVTIYVFPDTAFIPIDDKIQVKPTGSVGPAVKRDLALRYAATADLFAFIDDDAYPRADWLRRAVVHFTDEQVAAVGGPGITPAGSPLAERAGGCVYASPLASGCYTYRYVPGRQTMDVDDFPSCNFIIRRTVFAALGGFDNDFYPGEDIKLCLDVTKRLKKRIIYDPTVVVEHHRRSLFLPHLRQVAHYARYRGYFVKKYPQTSRRAAYFVPMVFVLFIGIGLPVAVLVPALRVLWSGVMLLYALLVVGSAAFSAQNQTGADSGRRQWLLTVLTGAGIFVTHVCYGCCFIQGLTLFRPAARRRR